MGARPLRPDCSLIICSDWILLPSCCLFYSLTYINFIINLNMTRGVKWHPCLEDALPSPGTHGTLCLRPLSQWDLRLDRSQSRVSPYRPIPAPQGSLLTPNVPAPLRAPSRHSRCPKPSRGFPLRPAGPAPLRGLLSTERTVKTTPGTPLPRVLADPTPPWVGSSRLTLSTPRAPVLSPQICCHHPGPRVAAAASSLTLAPESLFCRCSPVNTWVQSLNVRSSSAERPPAVSVSGPTLASRRQVQGVGLALVWFLSWREFCMDWLQLGGSRKRQQLNFTPSFGGLPECESDEKSLKT